MNDVTSDATQVTGQAEPGSTVTVTFPDGTTATGTADDRGNYTIDIPSNVDLNGGEELQRQPTKTAILLNQAQRTLQTQLLLTHQR